MRLQRRCWARFCQRALSCSSANIACFFPTKLHCQICKVRRRGRGADIARVSLASCRLRVDAALFLQNVDRSVHIRGDGAPEFQFVGADKVAAHINRERGRQAGNSKLNGNEVALIGQRSHFAA